MARRTTKAPNYNIKAALNGIDYFGKQINPRFVIDSFNKHVIIGLIKYFMNDPEFEKEGFLSLEKGIMLLGPIGTGKTDLMKAVDSWLFNIGKPEEMFVITATRTIVRQFEEEGSVLIDKFTKYSFNNDQSPRTYCFDDLGLENAMAKYFGNGCNVMAEILLDRYDLRHRLRTHATTNLVPGTLEKIYGDRLISRMREMFNVILLEGPDRRI